MPTKRAPRGPYKPRLATITRSHLRAIIERNRSARMSLEEILEWIEIQKKEAKLNMDKARQAKLGELSFSVAKLIADLAEIESSAHAASDGRVDEKEEATK